MTAGALREKVTDLYLDKCTVKSADRQGEIVIDTDKGVFYVGKKLSEPIYYVYQVDSNTPLFGEFKGNTFEISDEHDVVVSVLAYPLWNTFSSLEQ